MTYTFECTKCNHQYEVQMTMSAYDEMKKAPARHKEVTCPECDSYEKKIVITGGTGVNFGDGFTKRTC